MFYHFNYAVACRQILYFFVMLCLWNCKGDNLPLPPPPSNNDPCTAITLKVGNTCLFNSYSNNRSTDSSEPNPECANYQGDDVWFNVIVPASGHLIFDTDKSNIKDGGMALYSGTCNALTLLECDNSDSPTSSSMPMIKRTGLTPFSTIWVRFWTNGNNNIHGSFKICVHDGVINTFPYTYGFESGLINWINAGGDDFDWSRNSGETKSSNTGPLSAAEGSFYIYTEANGNESSKMAILESPFIDIASLTNPQLRFSYHMYGSFMGTLRVQVSNDRGATWLTDIWSKSGDQGNNWYPANIDLSPYNTGTDYFMIRFIGVTGNNYLSDMAIDNVVIE